MLALVGTVWDRATWHGKADHRTPSIVGDAFGARDCWIECKAARRLKSTEGLSKFDLEYLREEGVNER